MALTFGYFTLLGFIVAIILGASFAIGTWIKFWCLDIPHVLKTQVRWYQVSSAAISDLPSYILHAFTYTLICAVPLLFAGVLLDNLL